MVQQAEDSIEPAQESIEGSLEVDERENYPKMIWEVSLKKFRLSAKLSKIKWEKKVLAKICKNDKLTGDKLTGFTVFKYH